MKQHALILFLLFWSSKAAANDTSPYTDSFTQGQYPDRIYQGSKWLQSSPEFLYHCWKVIDSLYQRNHHETHRAIEQVKQKYPNSGVDHIGQALLWQSLMLENFDFQYEKQYRTHFQLAKQKLEQATLIKGNEIWENFIFAALFGIDTLHEARKGEWLSAIGNGMQGLKHLQEAKKRAPDFVDLKLGDGAWLYGRSLIPQKYRRWSTMENREKEGIAFIKKVEEQGIFLRPAASYALTYIWLEEKQKTKALHLAKRLHKHYPHSILSLQMLGRIQLNSGAFPQSEKAFLKILQIDRKNQRTHYYLGRLYQRWRAYPQAVKYFHQYLDFPTLSTHHRGQAHYYLGHAFYAQRNWLKAEKNYQQAWKYGRFDIAKVRLRKVRERVANANK